MEDLELRIRQFMSQLTDLTYKYKLKIDACSCCEGIHISPAAKDELERGMAYDCDIIRGHSERENGTFIYDGPVTGGEFIELLKAKPDGKVK